MKNISELKSPDVVKVVFDYNNYALYFSRSPIPYVRDVSSAETAIEKTEFFKHIGLYVYRRGSLLKFTDLQPTDLEIAEKLGLKPEECLFLGDTSIDMKTAAASGMYPVGALWGFRDEKELIESGAVQIVKKPEDIVNFV